MKTSSKRYRFTTTIAPWYIFIGHANESSPEAGAVTFTSIGTFSGSMYRTGSPWTSTASAQVWATLRTKRSVIGALAAALTRSGSNPFSVTAISIEAGAPDCAVACGCCWQERTRSKVSRGIRTCGYLSPNQPRRNAFPRLAADPRHSLPTYQVL